MTLRDAFHELRGRVFTVEQLKKECVSIMVAHIRTLPADLTARKLMELAMAQGWVVETVRGELVATDKDQTNG